MNKQNQEHQIFNELINELNLDTVIAKLNSATLTIQKSKQDLKSISTDNGWYQSNHSTSIGKIDDLESNIIEGEWCLNNKTHNLKLLNHMHLMTEMVSDEDGDKNLYQQQSIIGKDKINNLKYRIWWQCNENGKYTPFAQQFINLDTQEK